MIPVRMVQVALDEVVEVVTVRNALMAAVGTVRMSLLMAATLVVGCASLGVCRVDLEHMLINVIEMHG